MFLFAFNLYKQISLFTKHIFANKDITIPYYIYSCFVRSSPLPRPDVMPAGYPSGSSFTTTSRGSCLPSFTILATLRGKPPPPRAGEAACHPSPPSPLLEASRRQPWKLPAGSVRQAPSLSGHPSGRPSSLGGILHPATGKGHARHSSARRAVSRPN